MKLYRAKLQLRSALGTPLVGPTIFGQLCWIVRESEGEAALSDWLKNPSRMWRLSDGLPSGFLPKPLCRPRLLPVEKIAETKKLKKNELVRRDVWLKSRSAWDERKISQGDLMSLPKAATRIPHNSIDRNTGSTPEMGGLYFTNEDWRFTSNDKYIDLYIQAPDEKEKISALLQLLGQTGYGRDASTGKGQFAVVSVAEDDELLNAPDATRHVSLSRGVLTPETMRDAYWRVTPHFGKTGPQVSLTGTSPFKRPVLLTAPGASYHLHGDGPAGRWVTNIHPERPEIGLNGLHISLPFSEAA